MFAARNKSMAYSLVSPNTFALKLKLHCKDCERKVRNLLLKIQGVHSVKIDEKLGNVIISGTVDPATILTVLEKLGRKAEILWEQGTPSMNNSAENVQIITQSKVINPLNDPDIMAQLEQLSGIPGLQTVEITKTIKLTFQGESRNDTTDKILEISTTNNMNKPHRQVLSHDHYSDGGGFCAASSSCCGGHAAISSGGTRIFTPWGGAWPLNSQPLPMSAPPWSTTDSIPSAPPLPSEYFQAPTSPPSSSSPKPYTYYSVLSDENANGCIIQ
ncbi:uncharacterized protein [Nicotiana sylvestris]|uniref:Uncharacterized protein LOC104222828 isoform X2 n=1 Tax=Nicotiana sylvestris TaxID=4096 RepID=A0A1U7VXD6_NICSY|nr:PREDICTED: uncharacterized protein LOC104222828 isoform X2 [Nicotiana sylvestris]